MKRYLILILAAVFLLSAETLFQVKDSQDRVVLDVSTDGLRVYNEGDLLMEISSSDIRAFIEDNPAKGLARSFSVTTSSNVKSETNVLEITTDATQMREGDLGQQYTDFSPDNIFLGLNAGSSILEGKYNVFLGNNSGLNTRGTYDPQNLEKGHHNVFVGHESGYSNIEGQNNIFIGYKSGYSNTNGSWNVFIGDRSGQNSTAVQNTFIGEETGTSTTTGWANTFLGCRAGKRNIIGNSNTLIGKNAGSYSTGSDNTFIGSDSGESCIDGVRNTFIGKSAGSFTNLTGNDNVFIGYQSGMGNRGNGNVFVGSESGSNSSLLTNSLIIANDNTTTPLIKGTFPNTDLDLTATTIRLNGTVFADNNFHIGTSTSGNNRLRVESSGSGLSNSTGWFYNSNTAGVALTAMANTTDAVLYASQTNTSSKTARIVSFGSSYGGTWTEKLYVLNMGNLYTPNLGTGTGTNLVVTTGGEVVRQTSSKRYKKDIENLNFDTSKFMKLQPVSFKWNEKSSSENIEDYGLIAEEVEKIDPQLAIYDGEGEVEGVDYQKINIMLLKVVQEQQKIISDQEDRIARLEGMMEKMLKINENL